MSLFSANAAGWGFLLLAGLTGCEQAEAILDTAIELSEAEPPSPAESKVDVRTETTLVASEDFTVWIALPA